jgi:hypothetical protein
MLQLVYISSSDTAQGPVDAPKILRVSRCNNLRDGITGLLFTDGIRFLQALAGPADVVDAAFTRIKTDLRHRAVVLLSQRDVTEREFGPWEMAERVPGDEGAEFIERLEQLVARASIGVRGTFEGLAQLNAEILDEQRASADQNARKGPNRDEPRGPRLQHQAHDPPAGRPAVDRGNPYLTPIRVAARPLDSVSDQHRYRPTGFYTASVVLHSPSRNCFRGSRRRVLSHGVPSGRLPPRRTSRQLT